MRFPCIAVCSLFLFALSSCQPNATGEISEGVVPDSLIYTTDTLQRQLECVTSAEDPCLSIKVISLKLIEGSSKKAIHTMNTRLQQVIVQGDNSEDKASSPEEMAENMVKEYQRLREEMENYAIPWRLESELSVYLNRQGLFGVDHTSYSFTGGAHGAIFTFYYLFDADNGELVTLSSFLKPVALERLTAMGEQQFRDSRAIRPGQTYEEAGYWFEDDQFSLPENFRYNEESLEFLYNAYEIAPYSEGTIILRFDRDEVRSMIRPEYLLPPPAEVHL